MPEINKSHILLACLLQATTTNVIWRKRWGKWAKAYRHKITSGAVCLPLPKNKHFINAYNELEIYAT